MELNWSTFVLEIINFLILVWLLARFLYRPVVNVINKRRDSIQQKLDAAESVQSEADSLRNDYQNRVSEWEKEKSDAMKKLQEDLATERKRLMDDLQLELEQERKRSGILNKRQMEEEKHNLEREALQRGAAFSATLLTRLAGPELESGIIELVIEDMDTLSTDKQKLLKDDLARNNSEISITSVYPFTEDQKNRLERKLASLNGGRIRCTYNRDESLISGVRISIGSWLLQANLQGELKYFLDAGQESE